MRYTVVLEIVRLGSRDSAPPIEAMSVVVDARNADDALIVAMAATESWPFDSMNIHRHIGTAVNQVITSANPDTMLANYAPTPSGNDSAQTGIGPIISNYRV